MARVLIAGCGYVGTALGERLAAAGHTVWGLRRDPSRLPASIRPLAGDLNAPGGLPDLPGAVDTVFYTVGASGFSEAAYRAAYVDGLARLLSGLQGAGLAPARLVYTSSTGVYGQGDGAWLDEGSPATPERFSGRVLLEGEAVALNGPFPAVVLRLGGIYGPGRARLVASVRDGSAACIAGQTSYLNLIHRDDCAGALAHLMDLPDPAPVYLGVDHCPMERCALLHWIARSLGLPAPPTVAGGADSEPQRGGNRRFRNDRLVQSGYTFRHPTFESGFPSLL
jgi:nucleoside-diphosphate-sugar epimerase